MWIWRFHAQKDKITAAMITLRVVQSCLKRVYATGRWFTRSFGNHNWRTKFLTCAFNLLNTLFKNLSDLLIALVAPLAPVKLQYLCLLMWAGIMRRTIVCCNKPKRPSFIYKTLPRYDGDVLAFSSLLPHFIIECCYSVVKRWKELSDMQGFGVE